MPLTKCFSCIFFKISFITYRSCPHLDKVHSIFGKVVGGLDVLSKMEAIDTDKKERPKSSIKLEDCLVFVDPYVEVDEQASYCLVDFLVLNQRLFWLNKKVALVEK